MRNHSWDRAMHDVRHLTAAARRTQCRAYNCIWDGFDHYDAAHEVWDASGSTDYSSAYARFAAPSGCLGQGLRLGAGGFKTKILPQNVQVFFFGFAFKVPIPSFSNGLFLNIKDGSTNQAGFSLNTDMSIQVIRGATGAVQGRTGPGVLTPGAWAWLDLVLSIGSPSVPSGFAQIYINSPLGTPPLLNLSGINTTVSGNPWGNAIQIGDLLTNISQFTYWDDFHSHDGNAPAPYQILGDSRIYTKKANAAGYATNWTPNGAAANWQCSDDSPPDDDTTYNSSNTPGAIDGYATPGAGFTAVPNGVVRRSRVRRDDAGPHTFQNGIRSGSTNALGNAFTVPSSYVWTDGGTCYVNDPATGAPWATAAAADAAQMIIDETS